MYSLILVFTDTAWLTLPKHGKG